MRAMSRVAAVSGRVGGVTTSARRPKILFGDACAMPKWTDEETCKANHLVPIRAF
jgi:hypothetical protein